VGANPWDATHEAMDRGAALVEGGIEIITPDLLQDWYEGAPNGGMELLGADAAKCEFKDQNVKLPRRRGEFAWHWGDDFSQLKSAAARASEANPNAVVRIAHLDTGYDPQHRTFPASMVELQLQKNFVDRDRPDDARDLGVDGALKQPGHGTGTLSILAGGRFQFQEEGYQFEGIVGGAPNARIVPVRVGNSVVQISTSGVAKAISYVAELCTRPVTRVNVISMSMGGVASAAWADAVNKAYEAGIVFVAAAGNNYFRRAQK